MTMAAAEEALRTYCAPSTIRDYDALGSTEKQSMLEALIGGQRDFLLGSNMRHGIGEKKERPRLAKRSCPLVRAFLETGVHPDALYEDDVEECRHRLSVWGDNRTHPTLKLIRYQQVVAIQKRSNAYQDTNVYKMAHTNKTVVKTGHEVHDWSQLRKILIKDLALFQTSRGGFIEGTIVGEAIQPMVGGTTLMKDETGDVLIVAFYNMLPDGLYGVEAEPLLRTKFPLGATIRVAEPFLKIFKDGNRGVRVDNPSEIQVETTSSKKSTEQDCLEAKKQGNQFAAKKRYYAAMDSYLTAIRSSDFVPTILSNRAQAYISLEQWGHALCDAAASLTIRPDSKKTWMRYRLCMTKLMQDIANEPNNMKMVFESIIDSISPPAQESAAKSVDIDQGEELKSMGNQAFQKRDYKNAIQKYSQALLAAGGTMRALLSNWAFCSLEVGALVDVIAAATASLRIAVEEKAIYRLAKALAFLGEYELAMQVLDLYKTSKNLNELHEEVEKAQNAMKVISGEANRDPQSVLSLVLTPPSLLGNWIGPVETFMTDTKGRGVRATCDIEEGEVIFVERPIASSKFSFQTDFMMTTSQMKENLVDFTSNTRLKAALMLRAKRDAVFSQIMNRLSDGTKTKPLVPLSDLMLHLGSCPLLLPGQHEYFQKETRLLTSEMVENIVNTNIHGNKNDPSKENCELLPAISMMNHASDPNCTFFPIAEDITAVAVVGTCRHVKKGEELCMQYHYDAAAVARKWGISS